MKDPIVRVKNKDGVLVDIARMSETAFGAIAQGLVTLADNARKGTVEAITYTIVDTRVIIEVTTTQCLVRARLDKASRIGRSCSDYLDKLTNSECQPHVVEALRTTYNIILQQELNKVIGKISFEDVQFVNRD